MLIFLIVFLFSFGIVFFYRFYPQQSMPIGEKIFIETPDFNKYHNDCLHPTIRFIPEGFCGYNWWMVQSPYYKRDSSTENPILYFSNDVNSPKNWQPLAIVRDTPLKGYNSDPYIFYENKKMWVFWRECYTPLCDRLGVSMATVGVYTIDGKNFNEPKVFLTNKDVNFDLQQCPILIKKGSKYIFYAVNYQYKPIRKNIGISIWEGSSLEEPDFQFIQSTKLPKVYTCDKWKQLRLKNYLLFIPKMLKHDVWHFDLVEYNNKLLMLSVSEWGDNIMLGVSDDFYNFNITTQPLINAHYSNQKYFYKPTGFIEEDYLCLYYTARSETDKNCNSLFLSKKLIGKITK